MEGGTSSTHRGFNPRATRPAIKARNSLSCRRSNGRLMKTSDGETTGRFRKREAETIGARGSFGQNRRGSWRQTSHW